MAAARRTRDFRVLARGPAHMAWVQHPIGPPQFHLQVRDAMSNDALHTIVMSVDEAERIAAYVKARTRKKAT